MRGIPEATVIILMAEERAELEGLARSTKTEHRLRQRARIVLLAADGVASRAIGRAVGCTTGTASKWRVRYAAKRLAGLDETGERGAEPKYTTATNKRILALLDQTPPEGYARWTGPLLAGRRLRRIQSGCQRLAGAAAGQCPERINLPHGGDREFGTSLAELSVHAYIVGSGCKAIPHPEVPGTTKRPDYLVTDQVGTPLAYVEVTTVNPSHKVEAEKNRENPVYKAIDAAKIPVGTSLGYRLVRAGKSSPPLKPLVADVERWACDNAEAAKAKHLSKTFAAGEWLIELDLYADGGDGDPTGHAIDVVDMGGGIVKPQAELRDVLCEKTRKYGALETPYLIAVTDGKDEIFGKKLSE